MNHSMLDAFTLLSETSKYQSRDLIRYSFLNISDLAYGIISVLELLNTNKIPMLAEIGKELYEELFKGVFEFRRTISKALLDVKLVVGTINSNDDVQNDVYSKIEKITNIVSQPLNRNRIGRESMKQSIRIIQQLCPIVSGDEESLYTPNFIGMTDPIRRKFDGIFDSLQKLVPSSPSPPSSPASPSLNLFSTSYTAPNSEVVKQNLGSISRALFSSNRPVWAGIDAFMRGKESEKIVFGFVGVQKILLQNHRLGSEENILFGGEGLHQMRKTRLDDELEMRRYDAKKGNEKWS